MQSANRRAVSRELLLSYAQIVLGCLIGGAAYPMFLVPNNIAPGGLSGVAMIVNYVWPALPVGAVTIALNIPLFLVGWHAMGKVFVFRSLVATLLFSLSIDLLPLQCITKDPLLGTLYGGVLLGIGLGLVLRGGATSGGTDMVARMVHRRFPFISTGMFLFAIDCTVVLCAAGVMGVTEALYALIAIFLSSKVIDMVMVGFTANKACFIMTEKWEDVSHRLMAELGRGVTLLTARGGWTGKERPVVMCVASRQELPALKDIVRSEDDTAFMIVTEAHEALGEGFSSLDKVD